MTLLYCFELCVHIVNIVHILTVYSHTVEESVKDMDFLAGMERSQEKLAQKAFMVHSAR